MDRQRENHKKMSVCLIGSVQSNWCQTNLVSFNSKIIDFVSHLDFSKAFVYETSLTVLLYCLLFVWALGAHSSPLAHGLFFENGELPSPNENT